MPKPCSGGPIEAVFHVYNAGIGVCGCGARLTKAEWRQHYFEATAPEDGPCCATPLRPEPSRPPSTKRADEIDGDCWCGADGDGGCCCCTDDCPEDCTADHRGEQ